jgi:hypothetical protein
MQYVNVYDSTRESRKWVLCLVSPATAFGLYLLYSGNVGRFVPRFMQQYVMIENDEREDETVKISLAKNLEMFLRTMAQKNIITLIENSDKSESSFEGIKIVQVEFRRQTLLRKNVRTFYENEKKNILKSKNTKFPRKMDEDLKYVFESAESFFPKIMEYFDFKRKKRGKKFVVGSNEELWGGAMNYIKM